MAIDGEVLLPMQGSARAHVHVEQVEGFIGPGDLDALFRNADLSCLLLAVGRQQEQAIGVLDQQRTDRTAEMITMPVCDDVHVEVGRQFQRRNR
jgi:hypothetical protein